MTSESLGTTLSRVCESGSDAPPDYWALTEAMLQPGMIGHPDPGLRDDLIYAMLARWITSGAYTSEQLRHIVRTASGDEHLFRGFGARDDDTVLTRSFSVLLIPSVLAVGFTPPRTEWLMGFRDLALASAELGMPDGYARLVNVNHILRALYFVVKDEAEPLGPAVAAQVEELLAEFSRL